MPATPPLYQAIWEQVRRITQPAGLRATAVTRLALLVTGIIAARSCVLSQVAAELVALGLTRATTADSIARRLRRTLTDERLVPATCYAPVVRQVLDWPAVLQGSRRVVLALDESSKEDEVHLLRLSLTYWGGSLPLAWAIWAQNQAQPAGHYWQMMDRVLAQTAAVLPPGVEVVLLADRAYDTPALIDRLTAYGWHWVIRCKANGTLRVRDQQGREQAVCDLMARHVPRPGRRWKGRGQVFKDAGWRPASLVACWAPGHKDRLAVLTDLPPQWTVLRLYERRFWIEPGFRNDKSRGWQWEQSQVQGVAHHERLLLALAWASLVMLCVGVDEARQRLARVATRPLRVRPDRPRPARPQHPRESLFTLGLRRARCWLYHAWAGRLPWHLPDLDGLSWTARWRGHHAYRFIFQTVRP